MGRQWRLLLRPGSLVVIDRHYRAFRDYYEGVQNVYAVRVGSSLAVRHAVYEEERLVLRPENSKAPLIVTRLGPDEDHIGPDYRQSRVVPERTFERHRAYDPRNS